MPRGVRTRTPRSPPRWRHARVEVAGEPRRIGSTMRSANRCSPRRRREEDGLVHAVRVTYSAQPVPSTTARRRQPGHACPSRRRITGTTLAAPARTDHETGTSDVPSSIRFRPLLRVARRRRSAHGCSQEAPRPAAGAQATVVTVQPQNIPFAELRRADRARARSTSSRGCPATSTRSPTRKAKW
jgi:hypothetical protein